MRVESTPERGVRSPGLTCAMGFSGDTTVEDGVSSIGS